MPRKTATTWKTVTRTATCLAVHTRRRDARRIRGTGSWIRSKGYFPRRAKRWRMLRKFGLLFVLFIYFFPWRTNADCFFFVFDILIGMSLRYVSSAPFCFFVIRLNSDDRYRRRLRIQQNTVLPRTHCPPLDGPRMLQNQQRNHVQHLRSPRTRNGPV